MVILNFFTQENSMSIRLIQSGLLSAMAALLIACGGGGGGGGGNASAPPPPPSLSGIAAIGAAMANAKVTLKDSKGNTASTYADNGGNFSFSNVGGFTPPIMLQAAGNVGNKSYILHSLLTSVPSTGNINLNVTPATEALTAQTLGSKPETAFDSNSGSGFKEAKSADLAAAKAKLMAALQDTLLALGLDTEVVDLMTSKFAANNEGFDKLLDLVGFSATDTGVITLKDKNSNSSAVTIKANSSESVLKLNVKVDDKTPLDTTGSLTIQAGEFSLFGNNSSNSSDDLLLTFSNETAKKLNDANQTGKLKIRITANSKTPGQKTWEPPTFPLLFSSETEVKEFMKEKNWRIGQGLTTRSVTFTGEGILSVFAALKNPSYEDVLTIPYLATDISNKTITPSKTTDSCSIVDRVFYKRPTCETFLNNSIIMSAGLISFDVKGRGIVYLKVP